jgi:hypothetical protein
MSFISENDVDLLYELYHAIVISYQEKCSKKNIDKIDIADIVLRSLMKTITILSYKAVKKDKRSEFIETVVSSMLEFYEYADKKLEEL